jgi:hypothetical protein
LLLGAKNLFVAVYCNETLWNVTLSLPDHSGLMLAASKRLVPRDNPSILIRDLPWIVSAGCQRRKPVLAHRFRWLDLVAHAIDFQDWHFLAVDELQFIVN